MGIGDSPGLFVDIVNLLGCGSVKLFDTLSKGRCKGLGIVLVIPQSQ